MEDNLEVRVVTLVNFSSIGGRRGSAQCNEIFGELSSLIRLISIEVKSDWGETSLEQPFVPIDRLKDFVNLLRGEASNLVFNKEFPSLSKLYNGYASKAMLLDVVLEEILHLGLAYEGLHVVQKLIALLIRNLTE